MIQNDLGTTEAHVVIIHVEGLSVTVTYTDVHRQRARFFIDVLAGHELTWSHLAERGAEAEIGAGRFYLLSGHFVANTERALEHFLEFLGSRLVFMIDWNRARKALQSFIGKREAVELLLWSATHDQGHRGFGELGAAELVFEAIRRVGGGRVPYGARLNAVLGSDQTLDFLKRALAISSQGLAAGRSLRLLRDEIQADLAQRFESAQSTLLALLIRHLGLSRVLAGAIRDTIRPQRLANLEARRALASRAKTLEEKADRITLEARAVGERRSEWRLAYRPVIDEIENAADSLDECAFLLSLVPGDVDATLAPPLAVLADTVEESASDLVRAIGAVWHLPEGLRVDADDALQSIDEVLNAEKRADTLERDALAAFMATRITDARVLLAGLEVARALETTTDHLAHAALSLRSRVIEELAA